MELRSFAVFPGGPDAASSKAPPDRHVCAKTSADGDRGGPARELLVTAPIMFGKLHVAPVVHAFLDAYPEVTVRLVLSDQVIDLVESQVDVAVRIGRQPRARIAKRRQQFP